MNKNRDSIGTELVLLFLKKITCFAGHSTQQATMKLEKINKREGYLKDLIQMFKNNLILIISFHLFSLPSSSQAWAHQGPGACAN